MAKLALLEEINYHIGMLEDENNRLDQVLQDILANQTVIVARQRLLVNSVNHGKLKAESLDVYQLNADLVDRYTKINELSEALRRLKPELRDWAATLRRERNDVVGLSFHAPPPPRPTALSLGKSFHDKLLRR